MIIKIAAIIIESNKDIPEGELTNVAKPVIGFVAGGVVVVVVVGTVVVVVVVVGTAVVVVEEFVEIFTQISFWQVNPAQHCWVGEQ